MKWIKKVTVTPLDTIAKVIDSLQEQANYRTNAPSIRVVIEAINKNWETIYPIGSIYMCVNDINPSEVFGGTWVQIKDRFLLAAGDTYNNGATGGSATHTLSGTTNGHALTVDEMPSHTHNLVGQSIGEYIIPINQTAAQAGTGANSYTAASSGLDIEGFTDETGGGQEHSHTFTTNAGDTMPPYLVVKVWKRTA